MRLGACHDRAADFARKMNPDGVLMVTLTVRLSDATHSGLKRMAKARGVSVDTLVEEMVAALTEHEADVRFHALIAHGDPARATAWLDSLDIFDRRERRPTSRRKAV